MTNSMREALIVALSAHSSEGQAKLAAIRFFELAKQEGLVLDDFLCLKSLAKLRTPADPPVPLVVSTRSTVMADLDEKFTLHDDAKWLSYPLRSALRAQHQADFQKMQRRAGLHLELPEVVTLGEACQHYMFYGMYEGWYCVEVPSKYLSWAIKNVDMLKDRQRRVYDFILDMRDQGELPEVPEDILERVGDDGVPLSAD